MPKILLPIDVEHPHDEVVAQLDKLVPLKAAQVKLLYVKEELPSYESIISTIGEFPDDWQQILTNKVEEKFAQVKSVLEEAGASVTSQIAGGLAAPTIIAVAEEEGFDFIALLPGSGPRVAQYFLGSTTSRVVSGASNTVLILRPGLDELKHVVVAVDGSDESTVAAQAIVHMLSLSNRAVKITLINVVSMHGIFKYISPVQFVAAIEDNLTMSGEVVLASAENLLDKMGCKDLAIQLANGDPATEIIKLAEAGNAQLIVTGAQGHSALERFLLGTVSGRVATHANCSVAIIR